MKQEMLINVRQPEECRIAIVEDGVLEELYVERTAHDNYVGNIYKGVVVNLEPSIQAAFVDFGVGRNGFLHISDIEPQYFRQGGYDPAKRSNNPARRGNGGRNRQRAGSRPRVKPPIQDILRRGDEVLVQVIKEGIGTKGPTLSTYISIPGRYLVLMPALGRVGVSQRRGRRRPPPTPRHHARAEPAPGPGIHRPHRRQRPAEKGAVAGPGLPLAVVEGDRAPGSKSRPDRSTSTRKATC